MHDQARRIRETLDLMTDVLQRESAVPLYAQLEQILHTRITSGEWSPGQRIPSENELNRIYGLSRMTVRGVLTKLVGDGLLVRVPGKGTYVATPKINAISPAYRGVREQLEGLGYETSTRLVSVGLETPSSGVRERLALGEEDETYVIVRVRSVQGEPISLHRSYVPARLAPGLDGHDVVANQLCVVLEEHYGLPMKRVHEELEAVAVTSADAKHLGMRRGEPALQLQDVISDALSRPFEYSSIVFRGDRMRLRFDYDR
jgi:GntR family transcriptional regulator